MNRNALFLISLAVLTGISCETAQTLAKEVLKPNGAIIRQLEPEETIDKIGIEESYTEPEQEYQKNIEMLRYYEKIQNFDTADSLFQDLFFEMQEAPTEEEKSARLNLLKEVVNDLVSFEPNNGIYLCRQAMIAIYEGEIKQAEVILKKAILNNKNNPLLMYKLADVYLLENEYAKAIQIYENFKKQYPRELGIRLFLGKAYAQSGQYDKAIREYRVASVFEPDNNDTIVALNELYQYTNQYGNFYDPMTNVKPVESTQNGQIAVYSAPAKQPVVADVNVTDKRVAKANKNHEVKAGHKSKHVKKAVNSGKRVMVSYVNGRKVVKIVNLNSDSDTMDAVKNASATFESQLAESNAGYSSEMQTISEKSLPQTTRSRGTVATSPKYQLNEKNYYSNQPTESNSDELIQRRIEEISETTQSGDPNVRALTNSGGRKQLLVAYKDGKRVVQVVSPDSASSNQYKEDKKSKKSKSKKSSQSNVQTNTRDNTDLYIKANEYLAQEQYQAAIDVLRNVQPPTLRSLTAIASCYNSLGHIDTAIEYYKKADALSPNNTQILYSIGYLYYSNNNLPAARKYIDMALQADSNNQNALQLKRYMSQSVSNVATNSAVSYMNQGNYSEAKKILEKSLQANPNDFQSYYYLGHIYYATNKYEDSAKNFALAIKCNPDYALSYYSIGLAYDKLKEFNKSIVAYQQFLQMELDDNKYTQYAKTRINTIKSKQ